ncbi:MAG TPA: hypothetical protein VHI13_12445 [Candidatus Kapabacteria bacterium]|nr:hypothetical protein [Candidatus Kapabacteria bacterium]
MSYRFEFPATIREDGIDLPREAASVFRAHGIERVRVVITSIGEEETQLAGRGITPEVVERVAATQRFDPDVASTLLGAEGLAAGTDLGARLRLLQAGQGRRP